MNTSKLSIGLLLGTFMLLFALPMQAKEEVEKVLVDKKFDVLKNASLSVEHKFGSVKCLNWDESAISVLVTVTVRSSNYEKAQKIINQINIRVEGNKNEVSVESDFSDNIFNKNKGEISIDIDIMMPEWVQLDLENKFGSTYIEVVSGPSSISTEYGSLEIKALKNELNSLELGFGEANISYLHMGEVEVSYSTLTIGEALVLSVESEYSTCNIDKVQELDIESEGGKVEIGRVLLAQVESKFSEFIIKNLGNQIEAETEYGSMSIQKISDQFSRVVVTNSFGSVRLDFAQGTSFSLEAEMEFCSLDYPSDKINFSMMISEATEKYYQGTVGANPGKASVQLESSFGSISINL